MKKDVVKNRVPEVELSLGRLHREPSDWERGTEVRAEMGGNGHGAGVTFRSMAGAQKGRGHHLCLPLSFSGQWQLDSTAGPMTHRGAWGGRGEKSNDFQYSSFLPSVMSAWQHDQWMMSARGMEDREGWGQADVGVQHVLSLSEHDYRTGF